MDREALLKETDFFPLPLAPSGRRTLFAVRECLERSGYTEANIAKALVADNLFQLRDDSGLYARCRSWGEQVLDERVPLHVLTKLFLLSHPVTEGALRSIFDQDQIALLQATQLLIREDAATFRAPVVLWPISGCLVVTDWITEWDRLPASVLGSKVMALGTDSHALVSLSSALHGRDALDLCTGSGVVALSLARRHERVVGVEINARAVNFARFNALLNGLDNCEFLVEDVSGGMRAGDYDLITANPPFVPTPRLGEVLYRDGGKSGEEILSKVVGACTQLLRPGGRCLIVTDIVEQTETTYESKLREWLKTPQGFRCAIIKRRCRQSMQYIAAHRPIDAVKWIAQYQRESIQEVCSGYIYLDRRGSSDTFGALTLPLAEQHAPRPELIPCLEQMLECDAVLGARGFDRALFRLERTAGEVDLLTSNPFVPRIRLELNLESFFGAEPFGLETLVASFEDGGAAVGAEEKSRLKQLLGGLLRAGFISVIEPTEPVRAPAMASGASNEAFPADG